MYRVDAVVLVRYTSIHQCYYGATLHRVGCVCVTIEYLLCHVIWVTFVYTILLQYTEYLLTPAVRKRLSVPLTKSNRVEKREALHARFQCWWTLVRKLGGEVSEHFTEVRRRADYLFTLT